MQFTQQQLDEFKATFAVRRRRLMFAVVPFVLVALLFVAADETTGTTLGGLSLAYAAPFMIAVVLGMFVFAFKNWRCPACNAYMGKPGAPHSVPVAASPFSEVRRPPDPRAADVASLAADAHGQAGRHQLQRSRRMHRASVTQPRTADVLPVFHSTDPIEASAVVDALQAKGIPAIVIEDLRDIPFDHASWAAAVANSVPTIGSRPSVVVVPSSHQHAAIEGIRAFGPYRHSSAAHSAGMIRPIEGFGLQPTPAQRLIAWIVLVPTVIAGVVAAVRAFRQFLR